MATDPTGMSCKELVELITEYLEGTLPPEDKARFEQHLAFCDWCRIYLQQMRLTIQTLGKLSEESIPEDVKAELVEVFRTWKKT
ncbi:MAG TPA: zf-HC2 domain-containing protein [Candidatus Acidoferrales bacterium]|nr:zf-HC2 domain-containing protein [Candidatus Acidoferrales bacterium]